MNLALLYQDTVESLLTVVQPTSISDDETACFVCGREYESAGSGLETNFDFLSQLPGAFRKTHIETIVTPVRTPCNHIFCLSCISLWFQDKGLCTCPTCRTVIHIHWPIDARNTDDGRPGIGTEGLSLSLNISTPLAEEAYNIVKVQTRRLLTTTASMPFVWYTNAMLYDLPLVMVAMARRFHYQALRLTDGVPEDLSSLKRHNPLHYNIKVASFNNLASLACPDAPLAKHEDAAQLYNHLCDCIKDLETVVAGSEDQCANWEGPARTITYKILQESMPSANGGMKQDRWRAYVWCVIKALFVWQAYCERARELMSRRIQEVEIIDDDEGVLAYRFD